MGAGNVAAQVFLSFFFLPASATSSEAAVASKRFSRSELKNYGTTVN